MKSEKEVLDIVRCRASTEGWRLFRNNVGAGMLSNGQFIRWGLANESPQQNRVIKSGDLIGIRPVLITQEMIGMVIGQFVSIETKKEGWEFNESSQRETAQKNWINLIRLRGGHAIFSTGELK